IDSSGGDMDRHQRHVDGGLGDGATGEERQGGNDKEQVTHRRILACLGRPDNRQSDEKKFHIRSLALIAMLGCLRPCCDPPPGQLCPPVSVTQSSTGAPPRAAGCRSQCAPGTVSTRFTSATEARSI